MKQSGILTLNGQVNVCVVAVVCLAFPSFCVHGDKGQSGCVSVTVNGQVNVCVVAVVVCLAFPSFCVHGDKGVILL